MPTEWAGIIALYDLVGKVANKPPPIMGSRKNEILFPGPSFCILEKES